MTKQEDNDRACLETVPEVFVFIKDLLLPSIVVGEHDKRVDFFLRQSRDYNAGVFCLPEGKYRIYINEGMVQQLYNFCNVYGALQGHFMQQHVIDFADSGVTIDDALSISFTAGLVQILMHEYFHVAAGHVGYIQDVYTDTNGVEFCHSETDRRDDDEHYTTFRKITELEADGASFALTLQFSEDILESLGITLTSGPQNTALLHRAVLLGSFGAVCLLNGLFEKSQHANEEYPFPATRLINLCSSYLRVVDPDVASWRDGDYRTIALDDERAGEITNQLQSSVSRALFILHEALETIGVNSELFVEDWINHPEERTDFMHDVLMVLGGSTPTHSAHGLELVALSELRADMMQKLSRYRELDLWPMQE